MISIIYAIKDIILFPIRLVVAIISLLWSLIFRDIYPGCAPLFFKGARYILFIKRVKLKYCLIQHDLTSHQELVLYQSKKQIERYMLQDGHVLVCCFSVKNILKYISIDLNNQQDKSNIIEFSLPEVSRYSYVLLPKCIGIICTSKVFCDYDNHQKCYYRLIKISDIKTEIISDNIENHIYPRLSISDNEKYVSFETSIGFYIDDLLTGQQLFFPESGSHIYNWDNNSNLLIHNTSENYFLLLNPTNLKQKKINVPSVFKNEEVVLASISPNGDYVAYCVLRKQYRGKGHKLLIVQNVHAEGYKILSSKAHIFDIKWSDNGEYISIACVNKRDIFEISYVYKMKNAANHDKEIIKVTSGDVVVQL